MSYPEGYDRQFDFQSYQNANPTRPLPGDKVNTDLNAIVAAEAEIVAFLQGITRSDGALANGIVTVDSLDTTLAAAFGDVEAIAYVEELIAQADADVLLTHADVVLTNADVVLTHADVVLTHADVVTTAASAAAAAASVAALSATSATFNSVATGAKSFTTQTGKLFSAGQFLQIASAANNANYLHGTVTSYNSGTGALVMNITDIGGSGTLADWLITISGTQGPIGNTGATGPAGPVVDQTVRAATTANVTISTALNNGDSLDGVTLATGDLVLVKNQSAPAENGIYVVGVTPVRDNDYDTYNAHPGALISVQEGTAGADTIWLCTSNVGGTLNSTAIAWSQYHAAATDTVAGIVELATTAEAITATDTVRAVTPAGLGAHAAPLAGNKTLTGGFLGTPGNVGTKSSGTYTPSPLTDTNCPYVTNGGAHTLEPPATAFTSMVIEYTNNGSAGVITDSGFTKRTGDAWTTTNGHKFLAFVTKHQNYSHLHVQALQ